MYMYIYIYIHTHTHTHTHMYIHMCTRKDLTQKCQCVSSVSVSTQTPQMRTTNMLDCEIRRKNP